MEDQGAPAFNKRYARAQQAQSGEERAQLADALGVLELDERPSRSCAKCWAEKRAAAAAEAERGGPRRRRARRLWHIGELEAAIETLDPSAASRVRRSARAEAVAASVVAKRAAAAAAAAEADGDDAADYGGLFDEEEKAAAEAAAEAAASARRRRRRRPRRRRSARPKSKPEA